METVGNHRKEQTQANHLIDVGGHVEETVQGHHKLTAGERIERKTWHYQVQAGERLVFQGPGGSLTIDDSGVTLEAIAIRTNGPITQQGSGGGEAFALPSNPMSGEEPDDAFHLTFSGDA